MLTVYVVTVTLLWAGNSPQTFAVMDDGFYPTMAACVDDNRDIVENRKGPRPDYVKSIQCEKRLISFRTVKP